MRPYIVNKPNGI